MFKKIKRYLKDPYWALGLYLIKSHPNWMSDKFYICTLWRMIMGYKLNLKNPQTFNEKLQWLKLYDHNPLYTTLVDKLRVKDWVAEKIGAQYVIPTLAVYNSVDEIDLDKLPNQFVLKCNHDSGSVFVCKDKSTFQLDEVKAKLSKSLKHNFYWDAREWPYKNVKPCIFAEQYMEDSSVNDLPDYKFFTFSGKPTYLFVVTDRKSGNPSYDFYDSNYNHLDVKMNNHPNSIDGVAPKPVSFEIMKELASRLGKDIPQVRVDFYESEGKPFFGEMTFFHDGGLVSFTPKSFDESLGNLIELPYNKIGRGYLIDNQIVIKQSNCNQIGVALCDYKFFCFDGEPKIMYISRDRSLYGSTTDFYDMNFNHLSIRMKDPNAEIPPSKPQNFEKMITISRILSRNIPQVRVDFYEINDKLFFGEMTFYHNGGFALVKPHEWNLKLGHLIKI